MLVLWRKREGLEGCPQSFVLPHLLSLLPRPPDFLPALPWASHLKLWPKFVPNIAKLSSYSKIIKYSGKVVERRDAVTNELNSCPSALAADRQCLQWINCSVCMLFRAMGVTARRNCYRG